MNKILEGVNEALAFAKGDQPAARITINGHVYVPEKSVAAERERCARIAEGTAEFVAGNTHERLCATIAAAIRDVQQSPAGSNK